MNKVDVKNELKYDFQKYIDKFDELKNQIELYENDSTVSATSSEVIFSSNWHNEHYDESFNDAKERLLVEHNRRQQKSKQADYISWINHGIFQRRIQFEKANFYITTAIVQTDYTFENDFIISYWGDDSHRVEDLMQFGIEDESPTNGEVKLIGDFVPDGRNLKNVRYQTTSGRFEFHDAQLVLSENENEFTPIKHKIDTDTFFRLKFNLAGQGFQAKALYDTKNSIIDGAAGTGKSTIALQKLKYFHEKEGIEQVKMVIIIKNAQLKHHFSTLLQDPILNLHHVKIMDVDEFISAHFEQYFSTNDLEHLQAKANQYKQAILDFINKTDEETIQKHIDFVSRSIGQEKIISDLENLLIKHQNDPNKQNKIAEKENEIADIERVLFDEDIDHEEKIPLIDHLKKAKAVKEKLEGSLYNKAIMAIRNNKESLSLEVLSDLSDLNYNLPDQNYFDSLIILKKIINRLTEIKKTQQKIADLTIKIKNADDTESEGIKQNEKKLYDLEQTLNKLTDDSITKEDKIILTKTLTKLYLNDTVLRRTYLKKYTSSQQSIILVYLGLYKKPFNTIIVDEAQDYELEELELIRIMSDRTIITGDILDFLHNLESGSKVALEGYGKI